MKYVVAFFVLMTLAAAIWSYNMWRGSGFFIFDSFYLSFTPEALNDPRLYPAFEQECRKVLLWTMWPARGMCLA